MSNVTSDIVRGRVKHRLDEQENVSLDENSHILIIKINEIATSSHSETKKIYKYISLCK